MSDIKKCVKCLLSKKLIEFNKNKTKHDGLQTICRECSKQNSKEYYLNNKSKHKKNTSKNKKFCVEETRKYVLAYLSDHGCVDCQECDPVVLQFDHVKGVKTGNISTMIHRGCCLDTIKKEINKCEVRCANCHSRKTAKEFSWFKFGFVA